VYTLRAATVADADGVANVHVDSWRSTYRDFLPKDFLDNLSYETRAQGWARAFGRNEPSEFAIVAESEGQIVGFVTGGPTREEINPYTGMIYAIYLLEAHHKQGIGRAMFEQARAALVERGMASFMLWVLDGNPTSGFYEHMGGKVIGSKQDEIGGVVVNELAYGWL
jgi:GNAT superfamily N-acetyltransferase